MRGLKTARTASVIIRGHAFMQHIRRGHYELGWEARPRHPRVAAAFRRTDLNDLNHVRDRVVDDRD